MAAGSPRVVDREQVFDEDYLYFYEPWLTDELSDTQAEVIWRLLELEPEEEEEQEVLDDGEGNELTLDSWRMITVARR